jgi:adenine-specific DNA-methyltransferase
MDKLKMQTDDLTESNFAKLAEIFPNAVTETVDENGEVVRAIDADVLAQEINTRVVSGKEERYQFTWPDKKKSVLLANAPIAATLRPCREESVNFDTTENLYIEGDNLDVLKLLRETYLNRVKMIYIDPPYNTGNDFIYEDDFSEETGEFLSRDGQYDENGNRMVKNLDSNGRFHTDWLNMIYPRLRIARDLLTDDGVIFISIADNNDNSEAHNLRKICDEVFSECNFLCQAVWDLGTGTSAGHFTRSHEYILIYAKEKSMLPNFDAITDDSIIHGALKKISRANPATEITFPIGFPFEGEDAIFTGVLGGSEQEFILSEKMEFRKGKLVAPTTIRAGWGMANQVRDWIAGKETYDTKGQKVIRFWFNRQGILFYEKERGTYNPKSVFNDIANTKNGSSELDRLFGAKYFDFPKPIALIKYLLLLASRTDSIILDFFSGSATTAHAIMQLNAEDGSKRKFIMVQLPEVTDENSEAFKAGYKNICEIGKERIRRAGQKIVEEIRASNRQLELGKEPKIEPDIGFRVLKLDSTNMKEVYYTPQEYAQLQFNFDGLIDNIKDDRTAEDLLFQVMLDLGIPLSSKIEVKQIEGKVVYDINGGYLIACFETVNDEVVTTIAKSKPYYAIFRDSSFTSDSTLVNFEQIFKTYSPSTQKRVL